MTSLVLVEHHRTLRHRPPSRSRLRWTRAPRHRHVRRHLGRRRRPGQRSCARRAQHRRLPPARRGDRPVPRRGARRGRRHRCRRHRGGRRHGPGPFTGLRVGIAAARTFAAARGVPLLPLVSHDAIAADLQRHPVVVLTDARRREVYWSAHDETGTRVAGPGLAKPADLDEAIRASRPEAVDWPRETVTTVPAGRLGSLAADRLASGAPFADDTPLYLRDPDVTVPGAPKRVVR